MYDGFTYFAWFVFALLFLVLVALVVWLGSLPKKIAIRRNHPQVDAINACSWIGLAVGGAGWPIAFVWAFLHAGPIGHTSAAESDSSEYERLKQEVGGLKEQIAGLTKKVETLSASD